MTVGVLSFLEIKGDRPAGIVTWECAKSCTLLCFSDKTKGVGSSGLSQLTSYSCRCLPALILSLGPERSIIVVVYQSLLYEHSIMDPGCSSF